MTELFGNSISFQDKKYNFQSVLAKFKTILNVQSSKYNSIYFNVNYEIIRMILLKIKRRKSIKITQCLIDIEISYLLLNSL